MRPADDGALTVQIGARAMRQAEAESPPDNSQRLP